MDAAQNIDSAQIQIYARQLYAVEGSKAIASAAQKAVKFERHDDTARAQMWRRIEAALLQMRGPRET